jgi:streptogramin lyase
MPVRQPPRRIAALITLASAVAFASACSDSEANKQVPIATATPSSTSPLSSPTPWKPTFQEFALESNRNPVDIVAGADGNLWFTEPNVGMIGRMSASGTLIGEYAVPNASKANVLSGITLGSDNNVWFGDEQGNFIAKINAAGEITEIPLPADTRPSELASGPDGNVWFSTLSGLGKISPAAAASPTLYSLVTVSSPAGIISGPNNQIWFSEYLGQRVGHVDTNGLGLQEYPMPLPSTSYLPVGLTTGPDGAVWTAGGALFASGASQSVIGRVTAGGQISSFLPPTQITQNLISTIVAGPDQFLYAPESGRSPAFGGVAKIARITPQTGRIDEAPIPSGPSNGLGGITVGPDGNIWFTETGSSRIGRLLLHGVADQEASP